MPALEIDAHADEFSLTNATAMALCAQLAYKDPAEVAAQAEEWGFGKCHFLDRRETQAFVMGNDKAIVLSFRGTEPTELRDWMTDADTHLVPGPAGQVHHGFRTALERVWPDVLAAIGRLQDDAQSIWITGHSLGAALAALAMARFRLELDRPVYGLYTFGQPRCGDRDFARILNLDCKPLMFRFVNNNDVVTRVPLRAMMYSHIGVLRYLDEGGALHTSATWWFRFLDRLSGRIDDFLEPGTDGLKDHSISEYAAKLEKLLEDRTPSGT